MTRKKENTFTFNFQTRILLSEDGREQLGNTQADSRRLLETMFRIEMAKGKAGEVVVIGDELRTRPL